MFSTRYSDYVAHDTTYRSHSQTQRRYLQCYTHGPQSQNLNGSKSHTIRDTNVRQDIDNKILNTVKLQLITTSFYGDHCDCE